MRFAILLVFAIVFISASTAGRRSTSYPKTIPGFIGFSHGVKSGDAILLDNKGIKIKGFRYDGSGPDVFFYVGKGNLPNKDGRQIQNERGASDRLKGYEGKDIVLELPNDLTFDDIDWISVWCRRYATNFGYVKIPKN